GSGLDEGVQMGPVITRDSKARVQSLIGVGEKEGAKVLLDGRNAKIPKYESGNFVKPTIPDNLPKDSELANTEIFGPVLSLVHANDIDKRLTSWLIVHSGTRLRCSPQAARLRASSATKFRQEISASTSGLPLQWPISRSAAGKIVSSALFTDKDATPSSFILIKKSWLNAGRRNTRGNSNSCFRPLRSRL